MVHNPKEATRDDDHKADEKSIGVAAFKARGRRRLVEEPSG